MSERTNSNPYVLTKTRRQGPMFKDRKAQSPYHNALGLVEVASCKVRYGP